MSATPFSELRELQQTFWRLLVSPEGVAQGVRALVEEGALADGDLSLLVRPDARLDPEGRLGIYADMYFYRLRDALAEDFPKLLQWIGDAHFHNLATDYLLAHPSTHYSLRELGRALPDFLDGHDLEGSHPGAADLARLEWARVDVFDALDAKTLDRATLLERGGSDPAGFAFQRVPASLLLRSSARALLRWKEPEGDAAGDAEPSDVLVWRRDFGVYHRSLAAEEARALTALAERPATLASLGQILVDAMPGAPDTLVSERLATWLEVWTRDGLLRAA